MLTDDVLTRLLTEAGEAFAVPDEGPALVLEEIGGVTPARPWLRRRSVQLTAAAAVVVVAAVLAQNVGQGTSTPSTKLTVGPVRTQPQVASNHGNAGALAPAAGPAVPGPPDHDKSYSAGVQLPGTGRTALKAVATPDDAGGRVVKTGSMSLVVAHAKVSPVVNQVTATAKRLGGYVSDSTSQELGSNPSASLTIRVPVGRFEDLMGQVRGLDVKVAKQDTSGKDVTATYADTQAKIASLKAARSRFLTILSGARTIGETLMVQQRVDDVQGQIDQLEGQRRLLASQSDLATLTLTVGEKESTVLKTAQPSGWTQAWTDARHGFTSGVEGMIARSGRALLLLIVLAVGLVVLRLGWRFARRRLV
jgi:hypothetical protein